MAATAAALPRSLHELARVELCSIVAKQSLPILFPVLGAQLLICAVALGRVPPSLLVPWFAAVTVVHLSRIALLRPVLARADIDPARRVGMAVLMSAVSGMVNASSVLFLSYMTLYQQAIQSVLLLGLCAGCVAVNVGYLGIVAGFIVPIIGAMSLFWLSQAGGAGGWEAGGTSLLVMFFGLTLLFLARDTYRTFERSVAIRLENAELAQRLEAALARAEGASRSKTRFLASASHDLRQPLHTLSFLAAALELRPLDDKGRRILGRMVGALEDLSKEFDMLLDISKLDAGVLAVAPDTFALDDFIARVCLPYGLLAETRGLAFESNATPEVFVRTDRGMLERIVRNLLDNAFKYTPKGSIRVDARRTGDECIVRVADTGIGMAPGEHERVFEEFYQIDNPERDRSHGFGLGLPIVRRLADLLGARIEMQSQPGAGTAFSIALPAAERPPEVKPLALGAPPALRDRQLLVIDDEAASREAMQGYLEALGCQVSVAATITEATALAHVQEPDAVVADFRLRGTETGLQAIEALRKSHPNLPALLMTGDTAPERLAEMNASRIPLLHKPVSPSVLIEKLGRLLEPE